MASDETNPRSPSNSEDDEINRYIVELRSNESRNAAGSALIDKGSLAVPALIEALNDNDAGVRQYVVFILGEIGDTAALEATKSAQTDYDKGVSDEAQIASAKIRRLQKSREQRHKQETSTPLQEQRVVTSATSTADSRATAERSETPPIESSAHLEGAEFCSLCKRHVHTTRKFLNPIVLAITSFAGIVVASVYSSILSEGGRYSSLASGYLDALLNFAITMFFVLLIGSAAYAIAIGFQKKRCPICNAPVRDDRL